MVLKSPAAFEVNNHHIGPQIQHTARIFSVCSTCVVLLKLVMLITSEGYLITLCKNVQSAHLYTFCQATKFDCVLIFRMRVVSKLPTPHNTLIWAFWVAKPIFVRTLVKPYVADYNWWIQNILHPSWGHKPKLNATTAMKFHYKTQQVQARNQNLLL